MGRVDHYRFGPRLERFDEVLGDATWGAHEVSPPLGLIAKAAAATGDPLIHGAVGLLEELDIEGLERRGLVRLPREYREVYRYPEAYGFPAADGEADQARIRFDDRPAAEVAPDGLALYADVPFCAQACRYCTTSGMNTRGSREPVRAYLDAFEREARTLAERFGGTLPEFTCLFVGGGTGSYLELDEVVRQGEILSDVLGFPDGVPKTVEGNPSSVDRAKVAGLLDLGFDAMSLGVESFEDHLLQLCNRAHDAAGAERAIVESMNAGMAHLNIDIIMGLAGQTLVDFARTLQTIGRVRPGAVTIYPLRLHENTGFWRFDDLRFPAVNVVYVMQALARLYFARTGYHRTEGNRFVQDPAWVHAQHTHTRSLAADDLSIGTRAVSHVGRWGWANTNVIRDYQAHVNAGRLAARKLAEVSEWEWMVKTCVLPLKIAGGNDRALFARRCGQDMDALFGGPLRECAALGLLEPTERGYRMTDAGAVLETEVLRYIIAAAARPELGARAQAA